MNRRAFVTGLEAVLAAPIDSQRAAGGEGVLRRIILTVASNDAAQAPEPN
jgi:hypothetical protein